MMTNSESDPSVSKERLLKLAGIYLNGKNPQAPLASPIHADLTGLPPLLLQVGSIEVLLDDSTMLKEHAHKAGVSVQMEVWEICHTSGITMLLFCQKQGRPSVRLENSFYNKPVNKKPVLD